MLTETTELFITIRESGHLEVRLDRIILDGSVEVARIPHRSVLAPGDDTAGQDRRVVAVAQQAWTPDIVEAHFATMKVKE